MNQTSQPRRRFFRRSLAAAGAILLGGCDYLGSKPWFVQVLGAGEAVSRGIHRSLIPRKAMAQEFTEADLSPHFRSNGTAQPDSDLYRALAAGNFADWRLVVDGLVAAP